LRFPLSILPPPPPRPSPYTTLFRSDLPAGTVGDRSPAPLDGADRSQLLPAEAARGGAAGGARGRRGNHRPGAARLGAAVGAMIPDRKSTRLNSSHQIISYAVFCLKN